MTLEAEFHAKAIEILSDLQDKEARLDRQRKEFETKLHSATINHDAAVKKYRDAAQRTKDFPALMQRHGQPLCVRCFVMSGEIVALETTNHGPAARRYSCVEPSCDFDHQSHPSE